MSASTSASALKKAAEATAKQKQDDETSVNIKKAELVKHEAYEQSIQDWINEWKTGEEYHMVYNPLTFDYDRTANVDTNNQRMPASLEREWQKLRPVCTNSATAYDRIENRIRFHSRSYQLLRREEYRLTQALEAIDSHLTEQFSSLTYETKQRYLKWVHHIEGKLSVIVTDLNTKNYKPFDETKYDDSFTFKVDPTILDAGMISKAKAFKTKQMEDKKTETVKAVPVKEQTQFEADWDEFIRTEDDKGVHLLCFEFANNNGDYTFSFQPNDKLAEIETKCRKVRTLWIEHNAQLLNTAFLHVFGEQTTGIKKGDWDRWLHQVARPRMQSTLNVYLRATYLALSAEDGISPVVMEQTNTDHMTEEDRLVVHLLHSADFKSIFANNWLVESNIQPDLFAVDHRLAASVIKPQPLRLFDTEEIVEPHNLPNFDLVRLNNHGNSILGNASTKHTILAFVYAKLP